MYFEERPERGPSIVPAFLEPQTKALVDEMGEAMLARLGLPDAYWVVVIHGKFPEGDGFRYDLSLACDQTPDFARGLRKCFPRTRSADFRAFMGPLGDLNLENVDDARLRDAMAKVPEVKLPLTPSA